MLTTGPIIARSPERRVQELLNEFYLGYFNGVPHAAPLGDVTFPFCDLLFNQADLPGPQLDPATKQPVPQLHTVFTEWRAQESWWAGGDLGTWRAALAHPASGVSYGRTTDGTVEESVHGRSVRRLAGTDIRWRVDSGALVEEIFDGGAWQASRAFPDGSTELRWMRLSGNYVEQVKVAGDWTDVRTVVPSGTVWDGTRILVSITTELTHFIRVAYPGGDLNKSDFLARTVAGNLAELLGDSEARSALTRKGFRSLVHRSGPRPLPSQGYATRILVYAARLEYFVPKEGQ